MDERRLEPLSFKMIYKNLEFLSDKITQMVNKGIVFFIDVSKRAESEFGQLPKPLKNVFLQIRALAITLILKPANYILNTLTNLMALMVRNSLV